MDYKSAGVDIDAANTVLARVKGLAKSTFTNGVLSDIGTFGGLFKPELAGMEEPVLVASADGVGTKLKIAFAANEHGTVGSDLVNHCVNDVLVQGARPIFFLDYLATGVLSPNVSTTVIGGVAEGCKANGCALLGGETAEMPGVYAVGEYDLAGFVVGLVDRSRIIDGRNIVPGDLIIGMPSDGLHTNGFSLARRILFEMLSLTVESDVDEFQSTVGEELLRPHRSYLRWLWPAIETGAVKGIAHITGGGLSENIPRILPDGCMARIDRDTWVVPPVFTFLQTQGNVPVEDMYRTFNMGIGMILVCAERDAEAVMANLASFKGASPMLVGKIYEGNSGVEYGTVGI